MIITKKINVRVVPLNFPILKIKYPNIRCSEVIEIDINDLSNSSGIKIDCRCEICNSEQKLSYVKYLKNRNNCGYYSCKKCMNKKTRITKEKRYNDPLYNNSKKMIFTKEKLGIYIPLEQISDFRKYRKIVNRFTYKSKKFLYKTWSGYDYYDGEYIKNYLILQSKNMLYPTVDHKISIHEGFLKNIPPFIIGNINNICITKRNINLLKSNKINL
jgi:hypothetical protein